MGAPGVVVRLVLPALLVLTSFNPTGYSYFHYAKLRLPSSVDGLFALMSVLLLIAWVVLLRATFKTLGSLGVVLMSLLLAALVWVGADAGWWSLQDGPTRTWAALGVITVVLTVGLSWGALRRKPATPAPALENPSG